MAPALLKEEAKQRGWPRCRKTWISGPRRRLE